MKSLSIGNKILFFLNNILALLLALAYITSYISPELFPLFAILNFSIPVLWGLNMLFVFIWLIKFKKHFLLSLIIIILGWFHFSKLFAFSNAENNQEQGLKVMGYNVMQFYNKDNIQKTTSQDINTFIDKEKPDILCLQEYKYNKAFLFDEYNYSTTISKKSTIQTVIFSNYPIINSKKYNFYASNNSAKMADIKINQDTIRVFNVHFESLNLDIIRYKGSMIGKLEKTFKRQIEQFEMLKIDMQNSPYPIIFSADMNNTALSYLYKQITDENLKDTFLESGRFYGETFKFNALPVRIDMIFIDESLTSMNFKNYKIKYSDHFPIMTQIRL